MANADHLERLRQGIEAWNAWREKEPLVRPDLSGANLHGAKLLTANLSGANLLEADLSLAKLVLANLMRANLSKANLSWAVLAEADLAEANLLGANLSSATLSHANFRQGILSGANFSGAFLPMAVFPEADLSGTNLSRAELPGAALVRANLSRANLFGANLEGANLSGANLTGANLTRANIERAFLVETDLTNADFSGCRIYGMSAWDLKLEGAKQDDLIITKRDQAEVTVDNIEVAQFVYLLLNNEKIRNVIDAIGRKGVLLLGRFTEGRITVLERLREELRKRGFVPMVFNFDKPKTKDFTETVRLLAGLSRFIIADITNPRCAPLELQAAVPEYMVPFVPIIEQGEEPFAMFKDLWVKHRLWVLDPISYASVEELAQGLDEGIIKPALVRFDELLKRKADELPVRRMGDIIGGSPPDSGS